MKKTNFDYVNEHLANDETVLWEGRPQNMKLFEGHYGSTLLVRWVLCAIIIAISVWYYTFAQTRGVTTNRAMLISGAMDLFAVYNIIKPFLDLRTLANRTHYFITNRRFIIFKNAGINSGIASRKFEDMTEATLVTYKNGCGSLYIGPMTKEIYKNSRSQPQYDSMSADTSMFPIVFYSVADPKEIAPLLPKTIELHTSQEGALAFQN